MAAAPAMPLNRADQRRRLVINRRVFVPGGSGPAVPHSGRRGTALGAGSGRCGAPAAPQGQVDRGPAGPEQIGELGETVLARGHQGG